MLLVATLLQPLGFMPMRVPTPARLAVRASTPAMGERSVWPAVDDGMPEEVIIDAAKKVFAKLDTDGDGGVSDGELRAYLGALDFEEDLISKIFTRIDVDKSGDISAAEFQAAFVKYPTLRNALAKTELNAAADAVFELLDADSSGSISAGELRDHLRGFDYEEALIDKVFSGMDVDASGEVSKDELRKAFLKYPSLRSAPGLGGAVGAA